MNDEARILRGVILGLVRVIGQVELHINWTTAGADLQDDYQMVMLEASEQLEGTKVVNDGACRVDRFERHP